MSPLLYPVFLALFSVLVAALERLFPWRPSQKALRPDLWSDVVHLVFNGHFLGLLLYGLYARWVMPWLAHVDDGRVFDTLHKDAAATWPLWLQIIVAMVVVDFFQWCVHNLLHRVSFLWGFHKTHHSVKDGEMDWIVSFRFQWTEVVVYKSVLFFVLAFFGFSEVALLVHAIFGTLIGHLNHANLNWDYGPLKVVFNHPKMHIWHHDYDGDEKSTVNFGIIFSFWDILFGTAKFSDAPPAKLGFDGVETFPRDFFSQMAWPLRLPGASGHVATGVVGAGLLLGGWALQRPQQPATPMLGETAASSQPAVRGTFTYAADAASAQQAMASFGEEARRRGFAHPEWMVSADELARALGAEDLVVVDVRAQERFAKGHIPSSVSVGRRFYSTSAPIPGVSKTPTALVQQLQSLGVTSSSKVVLTSDGGPEPYRLWWTLREAGVDLDVRVLDGGLYAWKAAGHGVAEGQGRRLSEAKTQVALKTSTARPLWADLKPFVDKKRPLFIDTRSYAEHVGDKHHKKAKRKGRIPQSRHMEWFAVFDKKSHALQPPDVLRRTLGAVVDDVTSRPVVTWCQSGTRSSAVYFALLQAGASPDVVVNYDGSWAEYSRLALPLETGAPSATSVDRDTPSPASTSSTEKAP